MIKLKPVQLLICTRTLLYAGVYNGPFCLPSPGNNASNRDTDTVPPPILVSTPGSLASQQGITFLQGNPVIRISSVGVKCMIYGLPGVHCSLLSSVFAYFLSSQ